MDSGRLGPVFLTQGGHRRVEARIVVQLSRGIVVGEDEGEGTIPIAIVARVSSRKQAKSQGNSDKSSLEHQIQRVESYVSDRWGVAALERASRYYRCASGLNHEHPVLLQLVADILAGKFRGGYVVAQDDLRVMRFGIGLFQEICKYGGCEIVYAFGEEGKKEAEEDLTHSILGIITHFTAKASGLKARKVLKVNMSDESLAKAYRWYREGYSYRQIEEMLDERDEKDRRVSQNVIRHELREKWRALTALYGTTPMEESTTSFDEFASQYVKLATGKVKTSRVEIVKVYEGWCGERGTVPMTGKKIARVVKRLGWPSVFLKSGAVAYRVELAGK